MHILLTDLLSCPRCGPEFGLIVLADALEGRRVREGRLGCANCREEYPVTNGVADLRLGGSEIGPAGDPVPGGERAFRVAALLGAPEHPGAVLLVGGSPELVAEVDALLPGASVIAAATDAEAEGVSRVRLGGALPFRRGSLRGVALLCGAGLELLADIDRALTPGGRVVVDPAPPGTAQALEKRGFSLLLEQEGVVVASAPSAG
jgi:uncharacterized protein YbaR (Trm112 family)